MLASRFRGAAAAALLTLAFGAVTAHAATPVAADSTLLNGLFSFHAEAYPYCYGSGPRLGLVDIVVEDLCGRKLIWYGAGIERPDSTHLVLSLSTTPVGTWTPWDCWHDSGPIGMGTFPPGHYTFSLEMRLTVPPDAACAGGLVTLRKTLEVDVLDTCQELYTLSHRVIHTVVGESPCPACPPVLCPGRPIPIRLERSEACEQFEGLSLAPTVAGEPPNVVVRFRAMNYYCPGEQMVPDSISLPGLAPGNHMLNVIEEWRNVNDSTVIVLPPVQHAFTVSDFYTSACDSLPPIDPPAPFTRFELHAGPNPSAGGMRFAVVLPVAASVELSLFDLAGRRVARLMQGDFHAGQQVVTWDGASARSGLYFARLSANGEVRTTRVVLKRPR